MKNPHVILVLAVATAIVRADHPIERAAAALKAGDLATAESILVPLTETTAPDAAALSRLSAVRIAQKRPKDAVALAEKATQLEPGNADHFAQLGVALSMRMGEVGFMQQAMMSTKLKQAFEKAVELDPNNVSGLIGMSRFYTNAPEIAGGNLARAAEFANRVKAIEPFLGGMELGRIAERGENLDEALSHYESASAIKPDNAGAHLACGRVLAKTGRPDEARIRFGHALRLNPELEAAKRSLAELDAPAS